MSLKVIGAGLPRTGTLSLKIALEELDFVKCYHMSDLFNNLNQLAFWNRCARGKPVNWEAFFTGYQAAIDFPTSLFYKELIQIYPTAKVVLTVRNPATWYDSITATIFTKPRTRIDELLDVIKAPFSAEHRLNCRWHPLDRLMWRTLFEGKFTDKQYVIDIFQRHSAEVQRVVPRERLLIYEVQQGWEPLCRFLGVPVPVNQLFPHLNDRVAIKQALEQHKETGQWDVPGKKR